MTIEDIKEKLNTADYDFLETNEHLDDHIILLGLGGSHAYGTNVEGSDVDIRGIALPTKKEILLGRPFEQVENHATDTIIYSFNKVVSLLAGANPNVLEMLFLKPEHYLLLKPVGQELIDNRELFLSKKVFNTFGGYARAQLNRLQNATTPNMAQSELEEHILRSIKNAESTFPEKFFSYPEDSIRLYTDKAVNEEYETEIFMDVNLQHYPLRDYKCMWSEMHNVVKDYSKSLGKRAAHAVNHNKVAKHAMHLVRLLLCCTEILDKGTYCTYRKEDHDLLMSIRNGEYSEENGSLKNEFYQMVEDLEGDMKRAYEHTALPDKPDCVKIEELVCRINELIIMENL